MKTNTFPIGIEINASKERTGSLPIKEARPPARVVIPLKQHAGAPARPVVEKNSYVRCGQKIGEAQGLVSAAVHSSVSGVVRDICLWDHPFENDPVLSVVIDSDRQDKKNEPKKKLRDYFRYLPEEIISVISDAGVVGMGGRGFPSRIKLSPPKDVDVDTVILNGCECEPFLTKDGRLMQEYPGEVIEGLKIMMFILNANNGIIAVEEDKPAAIAALKKVAFTTPNVSVRALKTMYPQGAERQLIKAVTNRTVPHGKLPQDRGVVVHNAATGYAVYQAVIEGEPLIKRAVTVSGDYVRNPGNYFVRIGTLVSDILEECGYSPPQASHKVIMGGPMRGTAQFNINVPVIKSTTGIVVMAETGIENERTQCIRCGRCVEACPMGLMPLYLYKYARQRLSEKCSKFNVDDCMECGCCSYICPSRLPIVQAIKLEKSLMKMS